MTPIVPALIPKTAAEVKTTLLSWSFVHEIHIDVVDGLFVPFTSWPYQPVGEPLEVKEWTDPFTLEVDLMVKDSVSAARAWVKAGADMLVFHVESITLVDFISVTRELSVSIGIAASNDTPLADLEPYLVYADYVQLMGIAEIGVQGQPFDSRVLLRIAELKRRQPQLSITVDGSVNAETIVSLDHAGANRFICGSAVTTAPDPAVAYHALRALISLGKLTG